jgi:hypothetical protein
MGIDRQIDIADHANAPHTVEYVFGIILCHSDIGQQNGLFRLKGKA